MVPGGVDSFSFDASLPAFLPLEQIQSNASQAGEVLGAVPASMAGLIFVKTHIQYLVQAIFDAPVSADTFRQVGGIRRPAGDVVTPLHAG